MCQCQRYATERAQSNAEHALLDRRRCTVWYAGPTYVCVPMDHHFLQAILAVVDRRIWPPRSALLDSERSPWKAPAPSLLRDWKPRIPHLERLGGVWGWRFVQFCWLRCCSRMLHLSKCPSIVWGHLRDPETAASRIIRPGKCKKCLKIFNYEFSHVSFAHHFIAKHQYGQCGLSSFALIETRSSAAWIVLQNRCTLAFP